MSAPVEKITSAIYKIFQIKGVLSASPVEDDFRVTPGTGNANQSIILELIGNQIPHRLITPEGEISFRGAHKAENSSPEIREEIRKQLSAQFNLSPVTSTEREVQGQEYVQYFVAFKQTS